MARSASTDRWDQVSAVRALKLLVGVLVLSNIGLGLFSFFLLQAADQRYNSLIERTIPLLNDLQTLTARSVEAMRGTNPVLFDGAPGGRSAAVVRGQAALERDHVLRARILHHEWPENLPGGREEFIAAGADFTRLCGETLALHATGATAEAVKLREQALRPAFDHYLDATTKIADVIEANSNQSASRVGFTVKSFAKIAFSVAGWPLVAVMTLLLLTALFLAGVMLTFRGKNSAETS